MRSQAIHPQAAQPSMPSPHLRISSTVLVAMTGSMAWYMILGQELARASEMDEEIEIPTQDFTEEEDSV